MEELIPGMIGIDGLKEKEFNLAIGMKLKKALEDYGYQVVMTRETDTGLYDEDSQNKKAQDMQKRILLIQKVDPVLTVSIHQNSYEDPAVKDAGILLPGFCTGGSAGEENPGEAERES